jgi:hypothetical protein
MLVSGGGLLRFSSKELSSDRENISLQYPPTIYLAAGSAAPDF